MRPAARSPTAGRRRSAARSDPASIATPLPASATCAAPITSGRVPYSFENSTRTWLPPRLTRATCRMVWSRSARGIADRREEVGIPDRLRARGPGRDPAAVLGRLGRRHGDQRRRQCQCCTNARRSPRGIGRRAGRRTESCCCGCMPTSLMVSLERRWFAVRGTQVPTRKATGNPPRVKSQTGTAARRSARSIWSQPLPRSAGVARW